MKVVLARKQEFMNLQDKIIGIIRTRLIIFVLGYISSFFLMIVLLEMFIVIVLLPVRTDFQTIPHLIIAYTPFQKSFGSPSLDLDLKDIVSFLSFWSSIVFVVSSIVTRFFHPKFNATLLFILFSTLLHIIFFIRMSFEKGFSSVALVFLGFYSGSIVTWLLYRFTKKLR